MREDVQKLVAHYAICLQTKYETKWLAGLLQPLSIPVEPWVYLSLDFITVLHSSKDIRSFRWLSTASRKGSNFGMPPAHLTSFKVA